MSEPKYRVDIDVDAALDALMSGGAKVPCRGCTACCRGNSVVLLYPDMGDDVGAYRVAEYDGRLGLARHADGRCVYLGELGCTIYARRPVVCQVFDCRRWYLGHRYADRKKLIQRGDEIMRAGKQRLATLEPQALQQRGDGE